MKKMWGGRFSKTTDHLVEDFHSSISFDQRLYKEDIRGSIAHARMLGFQNIISESEADQIINGLQVVLKEISEGKVEFDVGAEDIHMNVESLLTKKIGDVGKKLHTGRSRNDQVALDVRLYLLTEMEEIGLLLVNLMKALTDVASGNLQTVLPGYTHLQRAQPINFAHHMLAYFEMFYRDYQRLQDAAKRTSVSPLGSGAMAGTTFPLNREMVQKELGLSQVTNNSLDGVSDRDFIIEFTSFSAILMMHLSRLSEEIIFWSSQEAAFIELDDAYSTGSSIMPQKKNPDVAELVRGKTGRVYGNLMGILTVMKGLPLAYNKDMQEDKEGLFDTIDTVKKCLLVYAPMLKTMRVKKEKMLEAAQKGYTNATDLADYLVYKGLPFRDAHEVSGKLVAYGILQGKELDNLTLEEFKKFSDMIEEDIYNAIDVKTCVERRDIKGGTGFKKTEEELKKAIEILDTI
ncbi:MAG: argininosuccinate lyase [Eubacteriales bacterium]|nr:argininosuccinate lyase [Eubacteriales bacterium]